MISGDLVNEGNAVDYRALKAQLSILDIECLLMVGNHDDRAEMAKVFDKPVGAMPDYWQYQRRLDGCSFVFLDTLKPGSDAGELCHQRMRWLRDVLASDPVAPVFLFMHHPPMPLRLPAQDEIALEKGAEFLSLIGEYPNVKYLFIGHVHRPVTGTTGGVPYATMRSILYQAPAPRPSWDWKDFSPAHEAPAYGVLHIDGVDVNLQYTEFCKFELGIAPSV